MKLELKTRGGSSPQRKERIYFTCYPGDFDNYFESICNEIFQRYNCVIVYKKDPFSKWSEDEIEAELTRMRFFVIPITRSFLEKNNEARLKELPFALNPNHKIPVLLLMQEEGLEKLFNEICGNLHFLDKKANRKDPTAISYEEKLEKFLSSVFLGDELEKEIRGDFKARFFLSYRKKDRQYAQELMQKIHKNEFCRDVAIWYDEFLVSGEDFSEEIKNMMSESNLVTMLVTPHLLESGNYVMNDEYPYAKVIESPILPAEMEKTDIQDLRAHYENVPEPINANDEKKLSDALWKFAIELNFAENDSRPEHLYLMGMAYLSGIDVEKDPHIAVSFITEAAENNVTRAMEKISEMYWNGDVVDQDCEKSIEWENKIVDFWKRKFNLTESDEDGSGLLSALKELANKLLLSKKWELCIDTFVKIIDTTQKLQELYPDKDYLSSIFDVYHCIGSIYHERGKYEDALFWYGKSIETGKLLCREKNGLDSREALNWIYCKLGELYKDKGKEYFDEARHYYEMSRELAESMNNEEETMWSREDLADVYDGLGELYFLEGKLPKAEECYEKCNDIRVSLANEFGTIEYWQNLLNTNYNLGIICYKQKDLNNVKLEESKKWYEKAVTYGESLTGMTFYRGSTKIYVDACIQLGNIAYENGDGEKAVECCKEAAVLLEKFCSGIRVDVDMTEILSSLAILYNILGVLTSREENTDDRFESIEWFKKCMFKSRLLYRKQRTTESRIELIKSYYNLAKACYEQEQYGESKKWLRKAIDHQKVVCFENQTEDNYDELARYYRLLGGDNWPLDIPAIQSAEKIWRDLAEQFPERVDFKEKWRAVRELFPESFWEHM